MTMSPVLLTHEGGQHFHMLNSLQTAKLTGEHTDGALSVVEFLGPRNFAPPLHMHDAEDEMFYILAGEVWLSCGDAEAVHGEGAVVWLPRGLPHTFQVRSQTARVLTITTPAGFDRFVAALGSPADSPVLPEPGPIDVGRVAEVCAEHNIQVLGPPPEPLP